jgi:hypothetical protein
MSKSEEILRDFPKDLDLKFLQKKRMNWSQIATTFKAKNFHLLHLLLLQYKA